MAKEIKKITTVHSRHKTRHGLYHTVLLKAQS